MSRTETLEYGSPRYVPDAAPGESVAISFASILKQMPQDLQGKNSPSGSAKFSLEVNRVLEQLPFGAVRVPFRELRRFAPVGVFVTHHTHDDKLIDLPLREIIPQLKPEYLARRKQVRLEAPEDGTELFNRAGKPVAPLRVIAKDELLKPDDKSATPAAAAPAPAPQPVAPAPPPEPVRPKTQKPVYPTPTASTQPSAPIAFPAAAQAALASTPPPQPQAAPRIPAPRIPVAEPVAQAPRPAVVPLPVAPAPAEPIAAPRIPAPSIPRPEEALVVPLDQLAQQWPDEIREIVDSWGPGFKCLLPMSNLGATMKSGAVRFTWGELRAWLSPAPPADDDGIFDESVLDLPLKVIAPLYMAKCRAAAPQRKTEVAGQIPDIFSKEGVVPPVGEEEETEEDVELALAGSEPTPILSVSLSLISQRWPDALRKEIALLRLTDCKVELPLETIEAALKAGKFECYWKQVCHWLNPCPTAALASPHADVRVDLPLNLIAPLYLKQRPSSDAAVDTARGAAAEPAVPEPPARNLAELFNEPDKRTWTPNEIVHKTSQLPGVAGALMALQDGLLVASCMPPEWKSETIAAFMPQIFGRMTQYTKELKMGELENISVTVEHGTFQIFNVGIIYFAALAKSTSKLPQESLKLIVRELARHTR